MRRVKLRYSIWVTEQNTILILMIILFRFRYRLCAVTRFFCISRLSSSVSFLGTFSLEKAKMSVASRFNGVCVLNRHPHPPSPTVPLPLLGEGNANYVRLKILKKIFWRWERGEPFSRKGSPRSILFCSNLYSSSHTYRVRASSGRARARCRSGLLLSHPRRRR